MLFLKLKKQIGIIVFILCIISFILVNNCITLAKPYVTSLGETLSNTIQLNDNFILYVVPKMDENNKKPVTVEINNNFEKLETPVNKGFKIVLKNTANESIINYLKNSPQMIDSARLRKAARAIKLNLMKSKIKNEQYANFYTNQIAMPIALFINLNMSTGPACAPIPLYLESNNKNYFFNSVIIIEDIPGYFSVKNALLNDTLDLVIAHENAHGIMFDMYGKDINKIEKPSNLGHDGPLVSDRGLAYVEGWAESFEALYGPSNPLMLKINEDEREKYRISEFLFTRQDPVRRERYIWQNYKGKKTGILKNGAQMLATEGVIAGIFYDILTSKALQNTFEKSVTVMFLYRPTDFIGFLQGWVKEFPNDKQILYRIFLENTNYATVSNEARKLYYEYYQAKLKYVQKQLDEKTFYTIKNKWMTLKESLFNEVMKSDNLTSNVNRDLWVEVKGFKTLSLKNLIAKILGIKQPYLNVATFTPDQIQKIQSLGLLKNFSEEDIEQFVKVREQMGVMPYKKGTEALREILGKEKAEKIIKENYIVDVN